MTNEVLCSELSTKTYSISTTIGYILYLCYLDDRYWVYWLILPFPLIKSPIEVLKGLRSQGV